MTERLNPAWLAAVQRLLDGGQPIDLAVDYAPAARWLVMELHRRGRPAKATRLGAGVHRVVSDALAEPARKMEASESCRPTTAVDPRAEQAIEALCALGHAKATATERVRAVLATLPSDADTATIVRAVLRNF